LSGALWELAVRRASAGGAPFALIWQEPPGHCGTWFQNDWKRL